MAEKLLEYYEKAKEKGGMRAQMKLEMVTRISSNKAAEEPDSPENIKVFEEALAQILQ